PVQTGCQHIHADAFWQVERDADGLLRGHRWCRQTQLEPGQLPNTHSWRRRMLCPTWIHVPIHSTSGMTQYVQSLWALCMLMFELCAHT
ncbi:hypothetical protein ATANTOWER_009302, partial [Ataeniobius toweri]|nr:hypothetical protein [Ataeniobius toweri]